MSCGSSTHHRLCNDLFKLPGCGLRHRGCWSFVWLQSPTPADREMPIPAFQQWWKWSGSFKKCLTVPAGGEKRTLQQTWRLIVINWEGTQKTVLNSELPSGLHWGHRRRQNVTARQELNLHSPFSNPKADECVASGKGMAEEELQDIMLVSNGSFLQPDQKKRKKKSVTALC